MSCSSSRRKLHAGVGNLGEPSGLALGSEHLVKSGVGRGERRAQRDREFASASARVVAALQRTLGKKRARAAASALGCPLDFETLALQREVTARPR